MERGSSEVEVQHAPSLSLARMGSQPPKRSREGGQVSKGHPAQFVVLCEDLQSQVFIRRALISAGANPRRIRQVALPATVNGGAGHDYVIKHYPIEVRAFRTQNAKASTFLVAHIDADDRTVAERHAQLAESLKDDGGAPREPQESIVELVPKRNIETWIYALDISLAHNELDEENAFPKLRSAESRCDNAAKAFWECARNDTSPSSAMSVPSLLDGIKEFKKLNGQL